MLRAKHTEGAYHGGTVKRRIRLSIYLVTCSGWQIGLKRFSLPGLCLLHVTGWVQRSEDSVCSSKVLASPTGSHTATLPTSLHALSSSYTPLLTVTTQSLTAGYM